MLLYVLVETQDEYDILVVTRVRVEATYECTWVITGLLPKRLHQSMLSL